MADAVTGKSQSNSQELADLAESYRRKRQEIIAQNEEEIKNLKDQYRDREETARETGDAAINHIRKNTEDKLEMMRENQGGLVDGENRKEVAHLKNMKSHNIEQEDQLKTQNETQEKYYGDLIQRARQEKTRTLAQEHEQTKKFETDQSTRRSDVEKATMAEVSDEQRKGAVEKAKVLAVNRDDLNKIHHEHRDEIAKTEKELKQQMDGERRRTDTQIKRERDVGEKSIAADRDEQAQQIAMMKSKLRNEYDKTRADGSKRIEDERKKDDALVHVEVVKGTEDMDVTRKHYDDEVKGVHARGQKEVATQKEGYRQQIQKQDTFYKGQMQKNEQDQEVAKQNEQEQFRQDMIEQDNRNKKALVTKNDEYQRAYMINENVDRQSLREQHDRFIDAAIKQKKGLLERYGKYDDAKDDPFYKMHEFETRIAESPNFYILKTKVPPHERHNVDILVKNDHVVVSGQRQFEEKVNHEGRKISTNSAESFREEIPLKHPTLAKGVTRTYEDGHVVVRIPKLPIA